MWTWRQLKFSVYTLTNTCTYYNFLRKCRRSWISAWFMIVDALSVATMVREARNICREAVPVDLLDLVLAWGKVEEVEENAILFWKKCLNFRNSLLAANWDGKLHVGDLCSNLTLRGDEGEVVLRDPRRTIVPPFLINVSPTRDFVVTSIYSLYRYS